MFDLYENIKTIAAKHGYTPSGLCMALGMSKSTLSNLKNKRADTLSHGTLQAIADFLGEPYDIVAHGAKGKKEKDPTDMTDGEVKDELIEILEELKDRPEMRMLFKSARNATAEQIQAIANMIEGFKK